MPESVTVLGAFGSGYVLGVASTLVLLRLIVPQVLRLRRRVDDNDTPPR